MKALTGVFLLVLVLTACQPTAKKYHYSEGPIFGTSFHITYEYRASKILEKEILELMHVFNTSLSNYDSLSVISRLNRNDETALADEYFTVCFNRAQEISRLTEGAFDMTVAPLVNLWGFGFEHKDSVYPGRIDSLLEIVGYEKVRLSDGRLRKDDPRIKLDASAIAKGFGVDVVSEFLESKGVENFLVEIGGELRCKGLNSNGVKWRVGVDQPKEGLMNREIQAILNLTDVSMATSGNYRQFYVENGVKYSHTIHPKTGYPVNHNLLSATVIANDCMSADAYATAFMVMGFEAAQQFVLNDPELEGYFIFSGHAGEFLTWISPDLEESLDEN